MDFSFWGTEGGKKEVLKATGEDWPTQAKSYLKKNLSSDRSSQASGRILKRKKTCSFSLNGPRRFAPRRRIYDLEVTKR